MGKASVGFLLDGAMGKHHWMIQRWIYNLILMFNRGSYVSVATYGSSVVTVGGQEFTQCKTICIIFVVGTVAPSSNIIDIVSPYAHVFAL